MSHWLEYLFLGLVQGVTEFLPVSSSGHLLLSQYHLGIHDDNLLVTVMLHFGTLVATVVFFRRRIVQSLRAPNRGALLASVVIAMIPTAVLALLVKKFVAEDAMAPATAATLGAGLLVLNGLILLGAHALWLKQAKAGEDVAYLSGESPAEFPTPSKSVLVGILQGFATLPGISRSGSTITGGMLAGLRAEQAFEFSFLLSIPAVGGAVVVMLKDFGDITPTAVGPLSAAVAVSAVVGYVCLALLRRAVTGGKLHYFAIYCIGIGLVNAVIITIKGGAHGG